MAFSEMFALLPGLTRVECRACFFDGPLARLDGDLELTRLPSCEHLTQMNAARSPRSHVEQIVLMHACGDAFASVSFASG